MVDWKDIAKGAGYVGSAAVGGPLGVLAYDAAVGGPVTKGIGKAAGGVLTPPKNQFQATMYDPGAGLYARPNVEERTTDLRSMIAGAGESAQGGQARADYLAAIEQERQRQAGAMAGLGDSAGMLRSAAMGQSPSVAELQQKQGMEQAIAAQMSQAASARGMSPSQAQAMAAQNIGSIQQGVAGDAAQLRAGEMAQARDAFARQQLDAAGLGLEGAGLALDAQGRVRTDDLAAQELKQRGQEFGVTGLLGMDQDTQQGSIAYGNMMAGQNLGVQGINAGVAAQNWEEAMRPRRALWGAAGDIAGNAAKLAFV